MNNTSRKLGLLSLFSVSENAQRVRYASLTLVCLAAGFFLAEVLSRYLEQRVFGLILFCGLQLIPLVAAFRMRPIMVGRIHLFFVAVYFLIALISNALLPQLKLYLASIFYVFSMGLILCAVGVLVVAMRSYWPTLVRNAS